MGLKADGFNYRHVIKNFYLNYFHNSQNLTLIKLNQIFYIAVYQFEDYHYKIDL